MSKLKNLVVFGAGYVLGAQAGRARYEQIKRQATRVAEHPKTQAFVQRARDEAQTRLPSAVAGRLGGSAPTSDVGYPEGGHVTDPGREPVVDLTERVDGDQPVSPPSHL